MKGFKHSNQPTVIEIESADNTFELASRYGDVPSFDLVSLASNTMPEKYNELNTQWMLNYIDEVGKGLGQNSAYDNVGTGLGEEANAHYDEYITEYVNEKGLKRLNALRGMYEQTFGSAACTRLQSVESRLISTMYEKMAAFADEIYSAMRLKFREGFFKMLSSILPNYYYDGYEDEESYGKFINFFTRWIFELTSYMENPAGTNGPKYGLTSVSISNNHRIGCLLSTLLTLPNQSDMNTYAANKEMFILSAWEELSLIYRTAFSNWYNDYYPNLSRSFPVSIISGDVEETYDIARFYDQVGTIIEESIKEVVPHLVAMFDDLVVIGRGLRESAELDPKLISSKMDEVIKEEIKRNKK